MSEYVWYGLRRQFAQVNLILFFQFEITIILIPHSTQSSLSSQSVCHVPYPFRVPIPPSAHSRWSRSHSPPPAHRSNATYAQLARPSLQRPPAPQRTTG